MIVRGPDFGPGRLSKSKVIACDLVWVCSGIGYEASVGVSARSQISQTLASAPTQRVYCFLLKLGKASPSIILPL